MRRRGLWAAAALALFVLGGLMVWRGYQRSPAMAASSGEADVGGPFALIDQHGQPFGDRDLKGRPSLIFFGFTYCPEVCPTTLSHMSAWLKSLGPGADKLNVVFVSIDPDRDTPAKLARYLSAFDPRIHGLTGTNAQIDKVADEYRVYHKKIPLEGGGYTMDHSAAIYELDGQGRFVGVLSYQDPDAKSLAAIKALIGA